MPNDSSDTFQADIPDEEVVSLSYRVRVLEKIVEALLQRAGGMPREDLDRIHEAAQAEVQDVYPEIEFSRQQE